MLRIAIPILLAATASAQTPSTLSVAGDLKSTYESVKNNLLRAADKMPEDAFGFRPVETVRTFGGIVAHVADAQFAFCGAGLGDTAPRNVEKTKSAKADIVEALKSSFALCDKAYGDLTDAKLSQSVKVFGRDRTLAGSLALNNAHDNEHYGNLVTYMRIKGLVPPSSEPRK